MTQNWDRRRFSDPVFLVVGFYRINVFVFFASFSLFWNHVVGWSLANSPLSWFNRLPYVVPALSNVGWICF